MNRSLPLPFAAVSIVAALGGCIIATTASAQGFSTPAYDGRRMQSLNDPSPLRAPSSGAEVTKSKSDQDYLDALRKTSSQAGGANMDNPATRATLGFLEGFFAPLTVPWLTMVSWQEDTFAVRLGAPWLENTCARIGHVLNGTLNRTVSDVPGSQRIGFILGLGVFVFRTVKRGSLF